ncbi:MAG: hypothetical protein ACI8W7_004446 [Gammaproteobacteria bacterium]|jgi:hypothetical protein
MKILRTGTLRKWLAATVIAGGLLACGSAAHAALEHTILLGGRESGRFGQKGLYLGPNFNNEWFGHEDTNWTWNDVELKIDDATGNATISGGMVRDYNNEDWGVTINLTDVEYRIGSNDTGSGWDFNYKDGGAYNGGVTFQNLDDLEQGKDAFTGLTPDVGAGLISDSDFGFEWKSLSMNLDKMRNSSSVPSTGWVGLSMVGIGHNFVAELHYDAALGGLAFDARYENTDPANDSSWYQVGDTKANGTLQDGIPPPVTTVSEPSTIALALLGLAVVIRRRRRRA